MKQTSGSYTSLLFCWSRRGQTAAEENPSRWAARTQQCSNLLSCRSGRWPFLRSLATLHNPWLPRWRAPACAAVTWAYHTGPSSRLTVLKQCQPYRLYCMCPLLMALRMQAKKGVKQAPSSRVRGVVVRGWVTPAQGRPVRPHRGNSPSCFWPGPTSNFLWV